MTRSELFPGEPPWGGHLHEIAEMRVSPESVIYKVWSWAPGFRTGNEEQYRSRKRLALAFQYFKRISKGTPREFIFRSVRVADISNPEDSEKSIECFRKAG